MTGDERWIASAKYVLSMLERLSADSGWAHQASGLRGSILHILDRLENEPNPEKRLAEIERLNRFVDEGYLILGMAAKEIPGKL